MVREIKEASNLYSNLVSASYNINTSLAEHNIWDLEDKTLIFFLKKIFFNVKSLDIEMAGFLLTWI